MPVRVLILVMNLERNFVLRLTQFRPTKVQLRNFTATT